MKRVGHLFEDMVKFGTLRQAALRAAQGKTLTQASADFLVHLESEICRLQRHLEQGKYVPGKYRVFSIYDHKPRRICAVPFRDRVVHHALCHVLSPMFEAYAIHDSYACRPGKGTHVSLQRMQTFAKQGGHFLKIDIAKFFDSIDHAVLLERLARKIKDRRLLQLLEQIVHHVPPHSVVGRGLPIGNLTSQHFANFYLGHFDHFVKETLRVRRYLRYMDDMVLFAEDKTRCWDMHERGQCFLRDELKLSLKASQTLVAPVSEGVPWLGFRIWPTVIRLQGGTARRFRKQYRRRWKALQEGRYSEKKWLREVHSLVGHIVHADTVMFRRSFFSRLEEDFRMGEEI